ncbi:MAG: response regulator [Bacteroidetes bacterium]|nr:response regulator [Bacteroidota bacterium]
MNELPKIKILIAEDDFASEILITKAVEMYSKETLNARTGAEAVEICRDHDDIDLIMMDIRMPEMNGYEATKQIRHFNKDVIIIAQTAFGEMEFKETALKAGCNDYITKPVLKEPLSTLLNKYFNFEEL